MNIYIKILLLIINIHNVIGREFGLLLSKNTYCLPQQKYCESQLAPKINFKPLLNDKIYIDRYDIAAIIAHAYQNNIQNSHASLSIKYHQATDFNCRPVVLPINNQEPFTKINKKATVQPQKSLIKTHLLLASEWKKITTVDSDKRYSNRLIALASRSIVSRDYEPITIIYNNSPQIIKTITGPEIMHCLHQEALDFLQIIQKIPQSNQYGLIDTIMSAIMYNYHEDIKTASYILDFCWNVSKSCIQGIAQGISNSINDINENPFLLATTLIPPQYISVYYACKILSDVCGIAIQTVSDKNLDPFYEYLAPLTSTLNAIINKEVSIEQLITTGCAITTQVYLQQKLLSGLKQCYQTIKNKAILWIQNNPTHVVPYSKTPDGILLQAFKNPKETVQKIDSLLTIKLHRTEDFFTQTEFGKKYARYFLRSNYRKHNKNAYFINKDINQSLKKGYSITLDALHKNHLELYDKNQNWIGVINFDGTLNNDLTKKGLTSLRRPLR